MTLRTPDVMETYMYLSVLTLARPRNPVVEGPLYNGISTLCFHSMSVWTVYPHTVRLEW